MLVQIVSTGSYSYLLGPCRLHGPWLRNSSLHNLDLQNCNSAARECTKTQDMRREQNNKDTAKGKVKDSSRTLVHSRAIAVGLVLLICGSRRCSKVSAARRQLG